MYLPAKRFGRLLRIAEKRLTDANLKTLLSSDFSAPTLSSDGAAHVVQIPAEDASVMRIPPETWGLQVQIVGRTFGRVPISFQCMMVPPTRYGLKLDFHPPVSS